MSDEQKDLFSEALMQSMTTDAPEPKDQDTAPEPEPKPDPEPAPEPEAKTPDPEPETDEQKTNWKALRESKKELEKKVKESEATRTDLVSQIEQLKAELASTSQKFDLEEFERLKEERQDLSNQLTELDILRSPEVKKARDKIDSEIKDVAKRIGRLAPELDGIEKVLRMDPREREITLRDMMSDLDSSTSNRIWTLTDRIELAHQNLEEITTSAQSNLDEWKQSKETRQQQEEADRKDHADKLYLMGLQAAQEQMPEWFALKDGDDKHNKEVSERLSTAKRILFEPAEDHEAVQNGFLGAVGSTALRREKAYIEAIASVESERQSLAEKLKAYEDAQPGASSGYNESSDDKGGVGFFAKTVLANTGG